MDNVKTVKDSLFYMIQGIERFDSLMDRLLDAKRENVDVELTMKEKMEIGYIYGGLKLPDRFVECMRHYGIKYQGE